MEGRIVLKIEKVALIFNNTLLSYLKVSAEWKMSGGAQKLVYRKLCVIDVLGNAVRAKVLRVLPLYSQTSP